ncbi:hypothetical protein BCON_0087g00020 [Botryotinia convoluta]|uniref:Uncharacterized protein n=1 Tax=Botryotinia convoluta TaxID=54673 RepID=A0A4Z1I263_9HELO|nr:hypothetical protein BCON_0087g00020 [Botryotinia convoluta]
MSETNDSIPENNPENNPDNSIRSPQATPTIQFNSHNELDAYDIPTPNSPPPPYSRAPSPHPLAPPPYILCTCSSPLSERESAVAPLLLFLLRLPSHGAPVRIPGI